MGGNLGFEDTFEKPEKFRTMHTYYYYCVDKSEKICTSWDRECGGDWSSAPPFLGERERERERLGFWNDLMASPWISAHLNVSIFCFSVMFSCQTD